MTGAGEGRLYLAGLSGAGKTAVAERIAGWLGWEWWDVDREVERVSGRSVSMIWSDEGEPAFREAERATVERLTALPGPGVIALGGGTLEDETSRARLAAWGRGVWLEAPAETLAARCAAADRATADGAGTRPLLAGRDPVRALREMAALRGPRFAALGARVDANGRPAESVAVDALRALEWPAPERIAEGVWVGRDALSHAGRTLAAARPDLARGPAVVIADERVWPLHGAALARNLEGSGWEAVSCLLPAGEAAKSPETLARLWQGLAEAGASRDAPVVVLGGGAACDVGGLAAATFKRGLPLALFPTTLLAQVDAAIGGKNAINFAGVKNMLGTFHLPVAVVIDSLTLLTLPEREYRSGWAEVVKAGVIGDPELLALCERNAAALLARRLDDVEGALRRAIAVKLRVVDEDPREEGRRAVLNLGHTLGHAIEAALPGTWTHGEAVAAGLVAAARLAVERGVADPPLADRIEGALERLGLPTRVPARVRVDDLLERVRHDKKRSAGGLRIALPVSRGRGEPAGVVLETIEEGELRDWIERTCAAGARP